MVLDWLQRRLSRIPIVGDVLDVALSIVPLPVLGAALGAAAVYGYDEGDPLAAIKTGVPKVPCTSFNVNAHAWTFKQRLCKRLMVTERLALQCTYHATDSTQGSHR